MEHPNYARHALDAGIQQLEHDLLEMGARADRMIVDAVESLVQLDVDAAREVISRDDEIDQLDIDIETRCIRLLALHQPIAKDLREVGTIMKMITDIERIGDLAVDVAKVGMKIDKELGDVSFVDLRKMADAARTMFEQALEAFVKRDVEMVAAICETDDKVDQLYRELRGQIHERMRSDPDHVVSASWLLLAIHHIERMADHAVNIAERVQFMVTGRLTQITDGG
jgi:phosphate transport system protein